MTRRGCIHVTSTHGCLRHSIDVSAILKLDTVVGVRVLPPEEPEIHNQTRISSWTNITVRKGIAVNLGVPFEFSLVFSRVWHRYLGLWIEEWNVNRVILVSYFVSLAKSLKVGREEFGLFDLFDILPMEYNLCTRTGQDQYWERYKVIVVRTWQNAIDCSVR